MLALTIDINEFPALSQVIQRIPLEIQFSPKLIKVGNLKIRSQPDIPLGGLQLPQQQAHEGRLPRAILANQSDLIAPENSEIHIANHRLPFYIRKTGVAGFHHQLARNIRLLNGKTGGATPHPTLPVLFTHRFERPHPPHIPSAASLDTLADPGFFLFQALVEKRVLALLFLQRFFLKLQISVITGSKTHQLPPVQLHDASGHSPDKRTVMTDKQHGPTELRQRLFEPGNGGHVKMVGRLIQQQNIRVCHQCPGQKHAALPAPGKGIQHPIRVHTILTQNRGYLLVKPPAVQRFQSFLNLHQTLKTGFVRLLG